LRETKSRTPRLTDDFVAAVRREMAERGFALAATLQFFDRALLRKLREARMVLRPGSKRWERFPQLARYADWLGQLLARALPEEGVSLAALEYRHEPAGLADDEVDRLHADGSYLRTVYTPFGPSTIYRDNGVEQPVPHGQTLLMTAQDRARAVRLPCTLHRRPGPGPEQAVIVCTFTP
jgi:hypothetical protein